MKALYRINLNNPKGFEGSGADACKAALINYGMIANGVLTTEEAVSALGK
jgi:hypothetical protein